MNVASALDDLFPARGPQVDEDAVWIERELIEPNPAQPRKSFAPVALADLGRSLRADGQLQACVVRPHPARPGHFQIISGERRWRAAGPGLADLPRLRCVVRQAGDAEAFRLALAENLHREDLSVVERARALVQIKESEPGFTWDKVAEQAQLSKRRILHLVELLRLPPEMVAQLESGAINEKHARALLSLQHQPETQRRLLQEVLRDEISGNAALARTTKRSQASPAPSAPSARTPAGQPLAVAEAASAPVTPVGKAVSEDVAEDVAESAVGEAALLPSRPCISSDAALEVLEQVVESIERAVKQVGEGEIGLSGSEPGFTLMPDPSGASEAASTAQAREQRRDQMRRIKSGIALLERALGVEDAMI